MKIAIVGRKPDTVNYVRYVKSCGHTPVVTVDPQELTRCQCMLLPGGGDITPAFFGEKNHGSRNIDTELDILQLKSLEYCVENRMPVLGICKGLQVINVGLGGSLCQDMPTAYIHRYENGDQYHDSIIQKDSWLFRLYGRDAKINSAHHQSIRTLGDGLTAVQHCPLDGCIEAVAHAELPILGVQWHPERLDPSHTTVEGKKVMDYFLSLCQR